MSLISHTIARIVQALMPTVRGNQAGRSQLVGPGIRSYSASATTPSVSASRRLAWWMLPAIMLLIAGCSAPVEVKWSTETEMNTAGFNLYRGESADGPFELKVNDQLIPASPDPLTGGDYTYLDHTTQSGVTYYYELEEVEQTGAATRHGPIMVKARGFGVRDALFLALILCCGLALWIVARKQGFRRRSS